MRTLLKKEEGIKLYKQIKIGENRNGHRIIKGLFYIVKTPFGSHYVGSYTRALEIFDRELYDLK